MSAFTCNNCGATFSCGCRERTASDGKKCCTACIAQYEAQLSAQKKP